MEVKRKRMGDYQNDCLYLVVGCPNQCDSVYERRWIENHIKNECPKRLIKCEYCDDEGEYAVIAGRHLADAGDLIPWSSGHTLLSMLIYFISLIYSPAFEC